MFQKENIGHAYFGESGEMGLKKDVKQCPLLSLYPHGMTSDLSVTSFQRLLLLQETNHPQSLGLSDDRFVIFVITLY